MQRGSDTHPSMLRKQSELLRGATFAKRFGLMLSLSQTTIGLAKRAIARRHPELSPRELDLEFVRLHYSPSLARNLERYLRERDA